MCRWLYFVLAVIGPVCWGPPSLAAASFEILSQSVKADDEERSTHFSVTFNETPDFFTVDEFDRPANAFQYWYDTDPGGFEFAGEDVVVIRGPEIRFGDLPVRESLNESGKEFPHAEGWGETRGAVPIELEGASLEFTVPWKELGEIDGRFSYRLLAFEYGEQTSDVAAIFIELPTPLKMGGVALAVMLVGLRIQRRRVR